MEKSDFPVFIVNDKQLLRGVEHQSVPLSLDVVVLRLLSNIQAIKLQLPGQLFLSFKDNQRDLRRKTKHSASNRHTNRWVDVCKEKQTHLEAVVADDAEEGDDGVDDTEKSHGGLHVACALFQEVVQGTFFIIIFSSFLQSRPVLFSTRAFKQARALEQTGTLKLLFTRWSVRHLGNISKRKILLTHSNET